jgi:hypothetical protein
VNGGRTKPTGSGERSGGVGPLGVLREKGEEEKREEMRKKGSRGSLSLTQSR